MDKNNRTNNYEELTFSALLNKYDQILVPMIQRDYAQGRNDKKASEVRSTLLNDIFTKSNVNFDLIFGSKEKRKYNEGEKNCFIPVDGQQRLTTLFLLHLYAQKTGQIKETLDLSKFSYDTRRAASDFCKRITAEQWTIESTTKVSTFIKDSVWFLDYWKNDPTVEGMLNMLDAIHENSKKVKFPNLDKIKFYFFDLDSNGLNENLYLKMNSRGKPLTSFENLKASIEKELPSDLKLDNATKYFPKDKDAPKLFNEKWKYFMDRNWNNAFWDKENPEQTDTNITAFIVRFLSGYWNAFNKKDEIMSDTIKEINNEENYSSFIPFETIKKILNSKKKLIFQRLAYALTVISDYSKIAPYWDNNDFPKTSTELCEYKIIAVVFTYVLFEGNEHAMHFAWNMVENTISGYDDFISYCKRIGDIFNYFEKSKDDIFLILSTRKFETPSNQLIEEIEKAKQILKERDKWEKKIIEAEKYAFFKGAIRFLFQDPEGNVTENSWKKFDTKWKNAQNYFKEKPESDKSAMNNAFNNATLLKALFSRFSSENFNTIWWTHKVFNNYTSTWKYFLLNNYIYGPINEILLGNIDIQQIKPSKEDSNQNILHQLSNTKLLDYVIKKIPNSWIRYYHNHLAIFPSAEGIFLNAKQRDYILHTLHNNNKIEIPEEFIVPKTSFLFGNNINFKYKYKNKEYYFQWYEYPSDKVLDIYLMNKNWKYEERKSPTSYKKTEEDFCFCFRVNDDMEKNPNLFIESLETLIKQKQADVGSPR